jgi:hypothetical protein
MTETPKGPGVQDESRTSPQALGNDIHPCDDAIVTARPQDSLRFVGCLLCQTPRRAARAFCQ